ncbi:MAG: O-antigen ligase family protein [Lentisphaerae bacterium]|nr:O-antigen ligase family protein [Lentisphaerota bacterium]
MLLAKDKDWTFLALLAAAFCMGFTLPAGRLFMLAAAVGLVVDVGRRRRSLRMPASGWLWLALVALAYGVTACGVNPEKGLGKLNKLIWFMGIPVAASLVDSRERLWQVLRALLLGVFVLAVRVCIRNPIGAQAIVARFEKTRQAAAFTFGQELIHQGSLVDGQRLMIGLVGAVALVMGSLALARAGTRRFEVVLRPDRSPAGDAGGWRFAFPPWPIMIGGLALAEIIVLKRGSWLSTLAVLGALLARRVSWKWLALGVLILLGVAVGVAPVRQRLMHIKTECRADSGGRLAMWTRVAPHLLRQYPQGIGFRAMTSERMRAIDPRIEPDRDHLHSNLVEMAVSLGWAGLALYLVWMGFLFRDAWQADAAPSPLFWMLLALFLNGWVEYNFADGEIVLLYGLLGGLAAAGRRLRPQAG